MFRANTGALIATAGAVLALTACGKTAGDGAAAPTSSASTSSSTAPSSQAAATPGSTATSASPGAEARSGYVSYADYTADKAAFSAGQVVLFFHADWCPTCRTTDANLSADPASLPAGLTVVKLDFDSETGLRQQYGVTLQHTFVQVAPDGAKLAAWNGTLTGGEIAGKVV